MTQYGGLSQSEATARLHSDGFNEVKEPTVSFIQGVLARLWEPSAWILEAALVVEIVLGKGIQAGFIVLMLLFAAVNGAIQSTRARAVLRKLSHELTPLAAMKRSDNWVTKPAKELVVGDLISLRQGDIIPADARLLDNAIQVNESSITGEAASVHRQVNQTVYAGTEVLTGHTLAVVTAIGADSRSGKTITLLNQSAAPGHLQQLLGRIINDLAILDSVLAIILIVAALIRGENLISMFPFLAMLFIATIPIAMPSSFAVANSVEAKVLSRDHVLVSDLSGIQEAANLDVLLVDKTGTITENKPVVVTFTNLSDLPDETVRAYSAFACDQQHPSVIDQAILTFTSNNHVEATLSNFTPFTAETGYASATITIADRLLKVRLGSLKVLQSRDPESPKLPPLALDAGRSVAVSINEHLVGVYILEDTIRADSRQAIEAIKKRGVQLVMLTGDNVKTAQPIALKAGLTGQIVAFSQLPATFSLQNLAGIAEVKPEDKLAIVQRLQASGHIVGMTGDGVNDAPAIRQAEVGIAVENAVDLAKRAAKMILLEPGLTSIIEILDSGHRVYQRMMTWTITKLSRTAELTIILTLGYLLNPFLPLSLNAMILVAILNDLVTLVLGTDRTSISHHPENWHLGKLGFISGTLAIGWTLVGMIILTLLTNLHVAQGQISTIIFNYLIFSAMLTILITRSNRNFWRSKPSRAVMTAITINIVLTITLSLLGWGIVAIRATTISAVLAITLVTGVLLTRMRRLL